MRLEIGELVAGDRFGAAHLGDDDGRGKCLLVALLVMKGEAGLADFEAVDPLDEARPVGRAAKLAIGRSFGSSARLTSKALY